jgi:hypothetical protein
VTECRLTRQSSGHAPAAHTCALTKYRARRCTPLTLNVRPQRERHHLARLRSQLVPDANMCHLQSTSLHQVFAATTSPTVWNGASSIDCGDSEVWVREQYEQSWLNCWPQHAPGTRGAFAVAPAASVRIRAVHHPCGVSRAVQFRGIVRSAA